MEFKELKGVKDDSFAFKSTTFATHKKKDKRLLL